MLPRRLTIGMLLATSVTVFLDLPYAHITGPAYISLSSAMACRVFLMVRLCNLHDSDRGLNTAEIEGAFRVASAALYHESHV